MLGTFVSFTALLVAFGALWFAGEANKRAEFQQQTFYDTRIKPIKNTISKLIGTPRSISQKINDLDRSVEELIEGSGNKDVSRKLRQLELNLNEFQGEIERLEGQLNASRPARRRVG